MKRDEKALNKMVAPEFQLGGTNVDGFTVSREIWMENTMKNLKIDSINYLKMKVAVMDQVAIVQSDFYWSAAFGDMPAKKETVTMVDTWIKRPQGWQVISRLIVDK